MELFNEYYSSEMQFLMDLFCINKSFTKTDFINIAKKDHVFAPYYNYSMILEKWIKCGLLEIVDENNYRVNSSSGLASFAAPINELEIEYLSDIVDTDEACLFIDNRVKEIISNFKKTPYDYVLRQNTVGKNNEPGNINRNVFNLLIKSINEQRRIDIDYCTNNDSTVRKSIVIPYRLEYSVFDGRWWLISYNEEQNRPIKSRLGNIKSVVIKDRHFMEEAKIRNAVMSHLSEEPVVLKIDNRKNGLERCFLAFENMIDMTATDLQNKQYQLCFRYFDWDRYVIVRKLLYLGDVVTVQSPRSIIDELVSEIESAIDLLENDTKCSK